MVWVEFEVGDRQGPVGDGPSEGSSGCRCVSGGPIRCALGNAVLALLLGVLVPTTMRRRFAPRRMKT